MIVRCANCQTEFSLDDRQVGPAGTSARCSKCGHTFKVSAPAEGEEGQPWQVRTVDHLLFTAPDLATLRKWIGEGRLHPDDEVSRTGRNWVRLGDMTELADAFRGFTDLPPMLRQVDGDERPEHSAVQLLGPPPAFGTTNDLEESEDEAAALVGAPLRIDDEGSIDAATHAAVALGVAVPKPVPPSRTPVPPPPPPPKPAALGALKLQTVRVRTIPGADGEVVDAIATDGPHGSEASAQRLIDEQQTVARAAPKPPPPPAPPAAASPSRPITVAPPPPPPADSRPASMLGAVTSMVRPITKPENAARAEPEPSPPEPPRHEQARRESVREIDDDESGRFERRRRRSSAWPLVAGLGVLAGVAVVFGIPSIRERVLGSPPPPAEPAPRELPEVDAAVGARQSLDPAQMRAADKGLTAAIDGGKASAPATATMRVTLAELLATRAIAAEVLAAIDPSQRADARYASQEDALRAAQVLADLGNVDEETTARVRVVKALVAVAQGRPEGDAIEAIGESDVELRNVVKAAPLWRDARAPVPDGVMAALAGVGSRSALGRLVLALAYQRSGDLAGARAEVAAILATSPDQPAARVMTAQFEKAQPQTPPEQPGTTPPEQPGTTPPEQPGTTPPDAKGGVPGENIDSLITKGCDKVEGGQAAAGIEMLERALARRPKDVDVLLCLGDGNAALGSWGKALKFYERALDRAPNMLTALSGAAKAAQRTGADDKALRYYRQVLEHDPTNAKAKAFVDAREGGKPPPPDGDTD